jgi:S1-C subfamily serine protease
MSEYSINLRSETPALLVEFNLQPGTHARIGSSSDAEIFLPLAGLVDFVCMIGRTCDGSLYVSEADGSDRRHIELPAALPLHPYQFVIFHPADPLEANLMPAAITPAKRVPVRKILSVAGVALAVLALVGVIVLNSGRKSTAANPTPQAPAAPPAAAPITPPAPPQPQIESAEPDTAAVAKSSPEPPAVQAAPAAEVPPKDPPPATPKLDLEALAARIAPSVFRLEVKDGDGNITGSGTAFAISADGLAVTNFHVVEGGESFAARTTQGAEFTVSGITAVDPVSDLALITLKASNLPFLELGESDALKIGAPLAVFGCPQGLSGTLSEGILSGRRTEPEIAGKTMPNGGQLLQITAPISAGSSGSPVIDHSGKVIGVAVAAFAAPAAQNLNFIIPVEQVRKLHKDSTAGLANFKNLMPDKRPGKTKSATNPDADFLNDSEFPTLKRYFDSCDWIRCLKLARTMAARHASSPAAHLYVGVSLGGLGLYDQAAVSVRSSLAIDPEDSGTWYVLGVIQEAQNKNREARESWNRAAGISPDRAFIWKSLALSYLREDEYINAMTPLENLRKLDRAKFEEILAIVRKLRLRSPETQSLLRHFDSKAENEPAAALPELPEKLAAVLIGTFLRHGEGGDMQVELADYADIVNPYFDQGRMTRQGIAKDLASYRAQWPARSLQLLKVESATKNDANTLEAIFRLQFRASDGRRTRDGILRQSIHYDRVGGRWLVSGIQTIERVSK